MSIENIGKLTELEFYIGHFETVDKFSALYADMLYECQQTGDLITARAMQALLLRQATFLLNEWLKEKASMAPINFVSGLGYGSNN